MKSSSNRRIGKLKKKESKAKSLHPSTLFHLTDELDILIKILESKHYKVSIAREYIRSRNEMDEKFSIRNFGVPMVSFCDIRLSQLDDHSSKYGRFGLGMTKSWAEKSNLNPVMYMSKHSNLFSNYNKMIRVLKNEFIPLWRDRANLTLGGKKTFDSLKEQYSGLFNVVRFMKNYEGRLIRKGVTQSNNYRFADEKEWRFVPPPFYNDMWPSFNYAKISSDEGKRIANDKFSNITLDFEYDDIKYIIVSEQADVPAVITIIDRFYDVGNSFTSKIITMDQIQDDM